MIDRLLVCDIDNTITGNPEALDIFRRMLEESSDNVGFAIATGRTFERAIAILEKLDLPPFEILLTETGTGIYYGSDLRDVDESWNKQIDHQWYPDRIIEALDELPGVKTGAYPDNGRFRIVSKLDPRHAPSHVAIRKHLRQRGLRVTPIFDYGTDLDVIPVRASRGMAIRFLCFKWNLAPDRLLIAGDSGNDADMLSGNTLGVVVGNHDKELEVLRGKPRVYFAQGWHAEGIIEGIKHYDFFGDIHIPEEEMAITAGGKEK